MPLSLIQSLTPWILFFILAGLPHLSVEVAALTGLISTFFFNFDGLKTGRILDWGSCLYFVLLCLLHALPLGQFVDNNTFIMGSFALAAIMWFSVIIKRPFTLAYTKKAKHQAKIQTAAFIKAHYVISITWALCLTLISLDGLFESHDIVFMGLFSDFFTGLLLLFSIGMTRFLPKWYQGYLFKVESRHKEDPTQNPFLCGNYTPVKQELDESSLPIEGKIPEHLSGIYMRNGPNPAFDPISYTYPFDGDGMIHAIYIQDGAARYKNKFVETKGLIAEKKAGMALYGGIQHPVSPDPTYIDENGDPGPVKDGAFIHIIHHAHQYLALYESGEAYELTENLRTIGTWAPKGVEKPFLSNAHTKLDPNTGTLFGFSYDLTKPYLRYFSVDKDGVLISDNPIDKSLPTMIHDFAMSENYLIFFDNPAIFSIESLKKNRSLLQWKPKLGTFIILIHKTTNQVTKIKTEPFFVFHVANAFEDEDKLKIQYIHHEQLTPPKGILSSAPPRLYETTIDLTTEEVNHTQLHEYLVEFPRINEAFIGMPYRYIYMPTKKNSSEGEFQALMKFDIKTNHYEIHDFGSHCQIGEAVFIKGLSPVQEDDGYLGLFVYNETENTSRFVLLSAEDISKPPVSSVLLPQRVPHGLHGSWIEKTN